MDQRICSGDGGELLLRPAAKRAARGGQHQRVQGPGLPAFEALESSRVLAVDRQEQPSPSLSCRKREVAGRDEALLVRQRERDAPLERPEGRRQAGKADDRVQDDVRRRIVQQSGQIASRLDVFDAARGGERSELAGAGGERADLEVGVPVDDLQRLAADRAGRAQNGDALGHNLKYGR
jgi:hypothetical protein